MWHVVIISSCRQSTQETRVFPPLATVSILWLPCSRNILPFISWIRWLCQRLITASRFSVAYATHYFQSPLRFPLQPCGRDFLSTLTKNEWTRPRRASFSTLFGFFHQKTNHILHPLCHLVPPCLICVDLMGLNQATELNQLLLPSQGTVTLSQRNYTEVQSRMLAFSFAIK